MGLGCNKRSPLLEADHLPRSAQEPQPLALFEDRAADRATAGSEQSRYRLALPASDRLREEDSWKTWRLSLFRDVAPNEVLECGWSALVDTQRARTV